MPQENTVFAATVLALFDFAMRRGWRYEELLALHGLAPLEDLDARVPYAILPETWRHLCAREPEAALGLSMARSTRMADHGIMGQLIFHSPDVQTALGRIVRFQRIFDPKLRVEIAPTHKRVRVRLDHEPAVLAMHETMECLFGALCLHVRLRLPPDLRDAYMRVEVGHPQRHDLETYQEVLGSEISFGHAGYVLDLDQRALVVRHEEASPMAGRYLEQYMERLCEELVPAPRTSMADRVRQTLIEALAHGTCSQAQVARRLCVSTRTLQRRLSAEGETFSGLLEAVRRAQAEHLLGGRGVPIYEIAYLLGYAEPSAFYRAFRRWYDMSPEVWRRAQM